MHMLVAGFFSVLFLHSASAGGAYCAKIARARAAAMGLGHPDAEDPLGLTHPRSFAGNPKPRGPVYYGSHHGPREGQTRFIKVHQGQHHQRGGAPIGSPWINGYAAPRGFLPKPDVLNHPDHDPRHVATPPRRQVVDHFEPENLSGRNNDVAESPFNFYDHNRHAHNRYEPRSFRYYSSDSVQPLTHDEVWGRFLQPQSRS